MKKLNVKLDTIDKVKQFLEAATPVACDIDVCHGRYVIDAKSLLGLFSLDLSKPVSIVVHDDVCAKAFMLKIDDLIVRDIHEIKK